MLKILFLGNFSSELKTQKQCTKAKFSFLYKYRNCRENWTHLLIKTEIHTSELCAGNISGILDCISHLEPRGVLI